MKRVEDTAMSAANSKWSAAVAGYCNDPYIGYFVPVKEEKLAHQNVGSYIRTYMINSAIERFYSIYGAESQVVVMGCGYDTAFWTARDKNFCFKNWFDLDLRSVVNFKKSIIEKNEVFRGKEHYKLIEIDFEKSNMVQSLEKHGFEKLPTLFIDEFSLVYVTTKTFSSILKSISSLENAEFVCFTMTQQDDEFGSAVTEMFTEIGIPLKSYKLTGNMQNVCEFTTREFSHVRAVTSDQVFFNVLPKEEQTRVMSLDIIEDPHEMIYILKHYITIFAGSARFTESS